MRRSKKQNGGDSEKTKNILYSTTIKKEVAPIFSDDHSNPVLHYF